MSAHEILEALQNTNIKAAIQVYRALEQLIAKNRVHRIESLNAFVVCRCEAHSTPAGFYICDRCCSTCEFDPAPALDALSPAEGARHNPARDLTAESSRSEWSSFQHAEHVLLQKVGLWRAPSQTQDNTAI